MGHQPIPAMKSWLAPTTAGIKANQIDEVRANKPPISEKLPARRKSIRCFGEFAVAAQEGDVAVVVIRLVVRSRGIDLRYHPGYKFMRRPQSTSAGPPGLAGDASRFLSTIGSFGRRADRLESDGDLSSTSRSNVASPGRCARCCEGPTRMERVSMRVPSGLVVTLTLLFLKRSGPAFVFEPRQQLLRLALPRVNLGQTNTDEFFNQLIREWRGRRKAECTLRVLVSV